ncbi:hypothetical protein PGRAT_10580 [Paenibacillus graminis]|uniref:Uncharacterized protein n=1 Tax=Paenibacillus graminis TaxID=189425 RepID=A0A089M2N7_9BACL|nr:hypothetical protein PGRAT_10580 [Paenibacillus graminis]
MLHRIKDQEYNKLCSKTNLEWAPIDSVLNNRIKKFITMNWQRKMGAYTIEENKTKLYRKDNI